MPRLPFTARFVLAAAALAFSTGCVKNVASPGCPVHGGLPWYEAKTKHFVVRTDLAREKVSPAVEELERGYAELAAAAGFPRGVGSTERLAIVILRDQRELSEYWPGLGGFSASRLGADIEHSPTLVFAGDGYPPSTRITFLHELTHRFIAYTYGPTPMWLNEGLAQYFSTLRVENGKMILGDVVPGAYVAPGVAPSVREILVADQATFYAENVAIPYRRDEVRSLYYSAAFALVHYLSNGPEGGNDLRTRFRLLRSRLAEGKPFTATWSETVGAVPTPELERDYLAYVTNWSWDRFVYPAPKMEIAGVDELRQLPDYEIDLEWARLLADGKDTHVLAKKALEAARSHAPESPEVAYRAGAFALTERDPEEARARFRDALADAPNDPRALFGYVVALERAWAGKKMPIDTREAIANANARLEHTARTADQLELVAINQVRDGALEEALASAEKAVAIDPGYFGGRVTRAFVHFAAKRYSLAIADQERAISLLPDHVPARTFLQDLAKFRAAAKALSTSAPQTLAP